MDAPHTPTSVPTDARSRRSGRRGGARGGFSPRETADHSGVAFQSPSRKASRSGSRPAASSTSAVFTLSAGFPLPGFVAQQRWSQLRPRSSRNASSFGSAASAARTSAKLGNYSTRIDEDLLRGGLRVALYDAKGNEIAEVSRSDVDNTVEVSKWRKRIPREGLEWLYARAWGVLDPFEDGTPLIEARSMPREFKGYAPPPEKLARTREQELARRRKWAAEARARRRKR